MADGLTRFTRLNGLAPRRRLLRRTSEPDRAKQGRKRINVKTVTGLIIQNPVQSIPCER